MSRLRKFLAVSFRAKVLVPVIFVMICLFVITTLVVNRRIADQFETEARSTLTQADAGFHDWRKQREGNLLNRVGEMRRDPRFRTNFMKIDPISLRERLPAVLNIAGADVNLVAFTSEKKELVGILSPDDAMISHADFEKASAAVVTRALRGEDNGDTVHLGDRLYDFVSMPILNANGDISGALTFGMEIGSKEADEISRFTRSEIVLLADDQVLVHTLFTIDPTHRFVTLFDSLASGLRRPDTQLDMKKEVFDRNHYYCVAGRCNPNAAGSPGYLLLYSYEDSWRALQTTQQILLAVNALAILLGTLIVSLLVGRVTRPLRELRDSAEAVGRGDFSRRVQVQSDDECGELARVFNQMTQNLKNSREQLEKTVETLKNTQAQLIQSEKLSGIGEFIAGVAHELNNPLTSVMGFSELLQNTSVTSKEKRYLDMIHKCALRCQKIVQALLGFARRSAPERKVVCVNGLIEAAVEILHYQLRTCNVEAIMDLDPNLPQALVDPHQLQQVFINLINNARQAIEAHQPKGWIKITTAAHGNFVRVIIEDNGPGIPEENLSKIFDPFFTTKEVGKGTGLGLSLVYGIIREHGGTIVPRSRPGQGALFIIELPVTSEPVETLKPAQAAEAYLANGQEGHGKRVLVIDDEEPILQMVREALMPHGYQVDIAPDGVTALRCMAEKKYDIALCDWKMPGLNGREVYERACAMDPAFGRRVIFITGDIINEQAREFLEQHHLVCLSKPFRITEFRAVIKKAMAADPKLVAR